MTLRELLFWNLYLQLVDGLLGYLMISLGAGESNPLVIGAMHAWGIAGGILYYKVLASALVVLIYVLGRRRKMLATRGLTITASVYLCFVAVCLWKLFSR